MHGAVIVPKPPKIETQAVILFEDEKHQVKLNEEVKSQSRNEEFKGSKLSAQGSIGPKPPLDLTTLGNFVVAEEPDKEVPIQVQVSEEKGASAEGHQKNFISGAPQMNLEMDPKMNQNMYPPHSPGHPQFYPPPPPYGMPHPHHGFPPPPPHIQGNFQPGFQGQERNTGYSYSAPQTYQQYGQSTQSYQPQYVSYGQTTSYGGSYGGSYSQGGYGQPTSYQGGFYGGSYYQPYSRPTFGTYYGDHGGFQNYSGGTSYRPAVPVEPPKPYNYEEQKPDVDPHIQMGSTKVRVVDVDNLNNVLKKVGDNYDQYWNQKPDVKNFVDDIQNFNQKIVPDPNLKPVIDPKITNNTKNILVTGLQTNITTPGQVEEPGLDVDDGKTPGKVVNNVINTNVGTRNIVQIDDLMQLTQDSQKLQQAYQKSQNSKFTDSFFPASSQSIVGFGESGGIPRDVDTKFVWLRPEQFLGGKKVVVFNGIEPTDIAQGGLGDCYFLASCSSIAEFGPRIERNFLTKQPDPRGVYAVAICIDGIWEEVVLDDLVPCNRSSNKPAFNNTKNDELWVILMEKAWAKVYGGYYNVAAGLAREALRDLTGASAKTFFTQENREELWVRILEANTLNFIMTAGTDDLSSGSDAYIEKLGICGGHCYSLLDAREVVNEGGRWRLLAQGENSSGKTVERILKLRNPWGTGEWKGSFSDSSPEWNKQLRQQLNYFNADDGVFYMTWNDFLKYYTDVQICYYHDNYKYSAIKLQSQKDEVVYLRLSINMPGTYYFSLNQKNRRKFRTKDNYKYSNLSYVVGRVNPETQTIDYVGGGMKLDKENWCKADVKAGDFFVMIKTPWQSLVNEFSFSVYGPGRTSISKIQASSLPNDFVQKLFKSHAFNDTTTKKYDFAGQGHGEVKYKMWDSKEGYGYAYFMNEGTTHSVEITCEMLGSSNIKVLPPFSGLRPSLTIEPRKTGIIVYEGISVPYSAQMRFMATFKPFGQDSNIGQIVKQTGTAIQKRYNNAPVDIYLYVRIDTTSMLMLYQNNTKDLILNEEVQFDMDNARIEGSYGAQLEVGIKPQSEKLVKVVQIDPSKEFSVKIKNLSYKVMRA